MIKIGSRSTVNQALVPKSVCYTNNHEWGAQTIRNQNLVKKTGLKVK